MHNRLVCIGDVKLAGLESVSFDAIMPGGDRTLADVGDGE